MVDTRDIIEKLAELVKNISVTFRKHDDRPILEIKNESLNLKQKIMKINDENKSNIEAAVKSMDKLLEAVETKIMSGILFSERAVKELDILFDGLGAYLANIRDFLTTGNEVLRKHVKNEAEKYAGLAREFATMHEERLIKGICLPRSSSIYLNMLNGLSGIFYNLGQLAD